jgi:uncharacterized membrane protein YkoI
VAPKLKQGLTVAAAVGAAAIGGTAMAAATGDRSGTDSTTASGNGPARTGGPYGLGSRRHGAHRRGPGGPGRGERALTGATAEKVKAAALARIPGGTVMRVETDRGGVYEAHVRRADGTEVEVKVNRSFKATAVEAHRHP